MARAEAPAPLYAPRTNVNIKDDTTYVHLAIARYSAKYDVSTYVLNRIVQCESGYRNIQSNVVKNGVREPSYGVVQIHLPSWGITKEQALDIDYSIEWAAKQIAAGKWWWYGYDIHTDTCN